MGKVFCADWVHVFLVDGGLGADGGNDIQAVWVRQRWDVQLHPEALQWVFVLHLARLCLSVRLRLCFDGFAPTTPRCALLLWPPVSAVLSGVPGSLLSGRLSGISRGAAWLPQARAELITIAIGVLKLIVLVPLPPLLSTHTRVVFSVFDKLQRSWGWVSWSD